MSHRPRTVARVIEEVRTVSYGRPAGEALAAAVGSAKGGAPLAPVTVIVGSNFAGLTARRLLGAGVVGGGGIANVAFVTPFRLAELVASDLLLDRQPLTNPVLGAAVRLALADDPGPFARVKDHLATEASLASLYAELSNLSDSALQRIQTEGGAAGRRAMAFQRSIAKHLDGFHGEADVARAAAEHPRMQSALAPFGRFVWYLPAPMTLPMAQFIGSVLSSAPSSVLIGLTGDHEADVSVWRTCRWSGVEPPAVDAPGAAAPAKTAAADVIVSVSDADEEVRAVIRRIMALAVQGVPLDRIGVFHPTPDPYVGILQQQFAAAGIPANGPTRRRIRDSVAGRTLLATLALPAQRWRRDRVMALVGGAPVRHRRAPARPASWETLTRRAGVVRDLDDWRVKVAAHRRSIEERISEADADSGDGRVERLEGDRQDLADLLEFVEDLASAVSDVDSADGWAAKAAAATSLLRCLLGEAPSRSGWPEEELAAYDRVEESLVRLAALDRLEPRPSPSLFCRALAAELDTFHGRSGRYGEGVMYGPLASAVGHDLDAVFVLGCAEGRCPAPRRDDAMLADSVRALTDGELQLRSGRLHDQHRWFLAALSAAPVGRRVLTFPRGDLRGGRRSLPSRWLLDSASAIAGRPVHATDFEHLGLPVVEAVPSFATGLRTAAVHGSLVERDLGAMATHLRRGGVLDEYPVADQVRRGLQAQAERRSEAFTEWDGNLRGLPIPSTGARPLSPTSLEAWATCGFRYFLKFVLGLGERDEPERVIELSALDGGSAAHAILEQFMLEVLARGAPDPQQGWTKEDRARLAEIAELVLTEYERRGRTGRPLHWSLAKPELLATLDGFLDADDGHRAANGSRPHRVEWRFGLDGVPPVSITLKDGRTLSFRGMVDRVDLAEDGRVIVSDYKTGKGDKFKGIADGDPVAAGTLLQLGLYAEAAVQILGAPQVTSHYWMVDAEGGYARHGYDWSPGRRERFVDVVTAIADGIEAGIFPAVPGEWDSFRATNENCRYCDFSTLCPRERGEHAAAKAEAPEMAARRPLAWGGEE
jgi:ATP-dependent helicase/nuclease subunit B